MANITPYALAPFGWLTGATPAVPKFYWNVVSQEQRWKWLCVNFQALAEYANALNVQTGTNADGIAELADKYQELADGGLIDTYTAQIQQWIDDNMAEIMGAACKQVYFGLTDDSYTGGAGYFVAYVPDSWSEITFDTGATYGLDTYGRLILRWDADSPYSVEQTPEYSDVALMGRITSVEATAANAMSLAETNEKDISVNDGEIAALDTRVTALESA